MPTPVMTRGVFFVSGHKTICNGVFTPKPPSVSACSSSACVDTHASSSSSMRRGDAGKLHMKQKKKKEKKKKKMVVYTSTQVTSVQ